jgi:DNA-binding protein YbaB
MAVPAERPAIPDRQRTGSRSDEPFDPWQGQLDQIKQITLARRDAQVRGIAADGQVVATVNGLGQLRSLRFAPTAVDRLPGVALENAIVEAVGSARAVATAAWREAVAEAGPDLLALVSEVAVPEEWW